MRGVAAVVHLAGDPPPRRRWRRSWPPTSTAPVRSSTPPAGPGCRGSSSPAATTPVGFTPRSELAPVDLPAKPGRPIRRQQGLRRGARPAVRRPLRHGGRLPADRLRSRTSTRRQPRPAGLAQPGRRGPAVRTPRSPRPTSVSPSCTAIRPTPGLVDLTPARRSATSPQDDAEGYADSISADGRSPDPLGGPLTGPSADARTRRSRRGWPRTGPARPSDPARRPPRRSGPGTRRRWLAEDPDPATRAELRALLDAGRRGRAGGPVRRPAGLRHRRPARAAAGRAERDEPRRRRPCRRRPRGLADASAAPPAR